MTRSRPLDLYWWSPVRSPRTAVWELRRNASAWARMTARGGRPFSNFGDELSRRVVGEVSGRRVRWAPPESARVIAIGSVLEHVAAVDRPGLIWGTGLRRPEFPPAPWADRRSAQFLAVRGALTRDALGLPEQLPLGDPGLLVRTFVRPSRRSRGVVVIPHFLAFNSSAARRQLAAARAEGLRVVPPSAHWGRVCEEVAEADLVLSSSLHGMVIADALDRPVQLVSFADTVEPAFKFADYQTLYGLSSAFVSFVGDILQGDIAAVRERADERRAVVGTRIDDVVERLARSGSALAGLP